uniref:(California timema) hypothetical protein n=1 Tax=Timema californicum TaxID=61474 RepID=A0A7R9PD55_TIMCA|nr:unnamed protein product [Timema californicum]
MTPVERRRIFWLVCCTLSWCATGLVVMASWNAFQNNAISFVVETTYLDWNTDFPSLTVCDTSSEKRKSREYANKISEDSFSGILTSLWLTGQLDGEVRTSRLALSSGTYGGSACGVKLVHMANGASLCIYWI